MNRNLAIETKVGIFLSIGVGLVMLAILSLGSTESLFSKKSYYTAHFTSVEGLIPGAKVILGGVAVGTIDSVVFDKTKKNIQVKFSVEKKATEWIKTDSTVEIATQGMLGDKYIAINMGSDNQPPLPPDSDIRPRPSKDLSHFITKGDQLMISLTSIAADFEKILKAFESDNRSETFFKGMSASAQNLSQTTERINQQLEDLQFKRAIANLNQILEKINNGTGTIGALINDPSLYDEVRALMGGVNRNRVMRNLIRQAIRDSEEAAPVSQENKKR